MMMMMKTMATMIKTLMMKTTTMTLKTITMMGIKIPFAWVAVQVEEKRRILLFQSG